MPAPKPNAKKERHYWIQIEVHDWNTQPNNINRMDGSMPKPFWIADALILRRYTENWAQPEDYKVNPWDLNEPDPALTEGTIPGPVLECNVGESIVVHFRNNDLRPKPDFVLRAHSLHPHGVVFPTKYDGAYPLSPPDDCQAIKADDPEADAWKQVGVSGFKQGDRVPPGGSFTYQWSTFDWPTTAGVWLYHDHSLLDADNTLRGAIGFIVVHNEKDIDDVVDQDLPSTGANGPLTCTDSGGTKHYIAPPKCALYLQLFHELRTDLTTKGDHGSLINGRRNLGNTPTLIGGVDTKMRFGVGAMNLNDFHTFHIHGHRWVIPGPSGNQVGGTARLPGTGGVQNSTLDRAVSQFEDTKLIGPANTFVMTIRQGSFMGPPIGQQKGEWHMHCHILDHMKNDGMMGSLLIVAEGDIVNLPSGTIPMPSMKAPDDDDSLPGNMVS